jgi:hypothetical protein
VVQGLDADADQAGGPADGEVVVVAAHRISLAHARRPAMARAHSGDAVSVVSTSRS